MSQRYDVKAMSRETVPNGGIVFKVKDRLWFNVYDYTGDGIIRIDWSYLADAFYKWGQFERVPDGWNGANKVLKLLEENCQMLEALSEVHQRYLGIDPKNVPPLHEVLGIELD